MNTGDFKKLTINPNTVLKEQMPSLEQIIEEFPYFQTAQVIYLKGLKKQHDFNYNANLKKVAAYTNNREVLFDFITADVFDYQDTFENETAILENIEVIDSNVINHLHQSISASKKEVNTDEIEEIKKNKTTAIKLASNEEKEVLELGSPINFNKNDAFSFNEWLQLPPKKPIDRKKSIVQQKKSSSNMDGKLKLIKDFVVKKPIKKTALSVENIDISLNSTLENTNLMTETLARVYLEQKKYDKAIAAFKILSLKYPEKSSLFANRIKEIKIIKINKL